MCCVVVKDCWVVHPYFGLNTKEWKILEWDNKPSEERNLTNISRGLVNPLCTPWRTLEGKVWPEGLCSSEGNNFLCWVVHILRSLSRSCVGTHVSVVELTSLEILPFHCLRCLINLTVFGLDELRCVFGYVWACCSLVPCGNDAHIGGDSGAERLMRPMDYGWVEHYNDIASCGTTPFQDKYLLC